jgi:hypothetical protein
MAVTIRLRRATAAEWTAANPTLASGEPGYESDTGKIKYGTGSTAWNSLPYYISAVATHNHAASDITSGTLADGRVAQSNVTQHQGALALAASQITSGTLASARFADNTIAPSRLTNQAEATLVGRALAAGTGTPTALTAAQVKALLNLAASDIDFDPSGGITSSNVGEALEELDAAIAALIAGAPGITALDLAGASTASFPSGANKGDQFIIVGAHASGTTLGSTNQEVVNTDDILLCLTDGASTTNGADWHVKDNTDKVVSVAGKTGSVTLAAADIASGTFANARIAQSNVTQHEAALSIGYGQLTGVPSTFTPAAHTLASHSDVTLTSIASGELLKWNGSAWINNTLAEAGIAAASHSHAASDITSGTFNNARIAAGNVTQHQNALSIAGSQLTGTIDGGAA